MLVGKSPAQVIDSFALLPISTLLRRLIDFSQCVNIWEVSYAIGQYNVVSRICETRPLFNDAIVTIRMQGILFAHAHYKSVNSESTRAAAGVANIQSVARRMTNTQDLLRWRLELTLIWAIWNNVLHFW